MVSLPRHASEGRVNLDCAPRRRAFGSVISRRPDCGAGSKRSPRGHRHAGVRHRTRAGDRHPGVLCKLACEGDSRGHRHAGVIRKLACVLTLCALACGVEPSAPELEDLQITSAVRAGEPFEATVRYRDGDGDILRGRAEVSLRRQTDTDGTLFELALEGDDSNSGTLALTVTMPRGAIPGSYELAVTVIDGAGRRSAPAVTTFALE